MILFELRCGKDHRFDAWFRDNAAFDQQSAHGLIACPTCADTKVEKAPMAPRLNKATGQALDAPDMARAMRQALGEIRKSVEANCDYVGEKFPEEARKIHYGETEARPIYGEATQDEAKELAEEGVAFQPIPWVADEN
ncbi:DUF1178 family protein [Magnetospirillum sp. 64-120]|mgnify:CR=1 FL=1|uniref:DUF1178 family protein n=1 Tax=Magnetospirillum sp. 64-120 TaxID=1895778 RepID=UPI00092C9FAB|nr:DUF1178 family protein [Magnetospirillum sp. 64-120]OJX68135.1 MAG: hypothetical protein BGO92_05630 [Magnetospirillum sp. 64-120]